MKRFASHYIFLPEYGFLKQYVVELDDERVIRLFPLTEEIESAEWLPGIIVLTDEAVPGDVWEKAESWVGEDEFRKDNRVLAEPPPAFPEKLAAGCWRACLLFPFDFTSMRPVAGIRHRLLR